MTFAGVAFILAAAAQCNQGTTYDMRTCWSEQSDAADAELRQAYAEASARLRAWGINSAPLADAQAAWETARDKTCEFEYRRYLPGTIAPLLGAECDVRMTRARTQRLTVLLASMQTRDARSSERAVSAAAAAELKRVYDLYSARITVDERALLAAAEAAWTVYRGKACAVEGGSCLTELTNERVLELEDSWIGEAFW